ncbi:MAG: hypothetical protein N2450_02525 [bacterium]|nr:hypothetical protein [bacterium]
MIIGIDAGGTSTRAILYSQGEILDSCTAGPGNLKLLGMEKTIQHLFNIIEPILTKHQVCPSLIIIGLAGAGNAQDRFTLQRELSNILRIPCKVETDALIALYGAFDGESGMILIAGTGSIAYGITKDKNEPVRVGGWGWQLGDEGSGVWLGREALRCVLLAYDGRGEGTLLKDVLLEKLALTNEEQILQIVYSPNWTATKFAELAPIVLSIFNEDVVARKLVRLAASHLGNHLIALQKMLGGPEKVRDVVLIGGLIENDTFLRNELLNELYHYGTFEIKSPMFSPVLGAVRLAERLLKNHEFHY